MRVMIANGEEKGEDPPPFAPGAPPPPDPSGVENGAALAPSQNAVPNISPRSENVPILPAPLPTSSTQEHRPSASAASARPAGTTEAQRGRTNGKQRAPILATRPDVSGPESSSDDVGGDGKEGRDVDAGQCDTPVRGGEQQHASRLGATGAGVSQEFSPTGVMSSSDAGGDRKSSASSAAGFAAREAMGALAVKAAPAVAVAAEEELERCFEAELRAKGWELRRQEGDGNCLFRAISQHIYGDPGMHGDIRRQCLDFMRKERDHYSQFVSEAFDSYVTRKEQDGVHGNNPEMQAACELFNRPIEVYVPEKGTVPINIFHGGYRSGNAPIRVSYHGNSHYNAVVDPEEASVGQGLGVPGLSKEAAEKESLKRALAESCSSAHQVFPGDSPAFFKGGRGAHGGFGGDFGESDWRATEEELEQAAITASLADFHGTSSGGSLYGTSESRDFPPHTGSGSSAFGRNSNSSDFLAGTGKGSDASFSVPRRGGRGSHGSGVSSGGGGGVGGRLSGRGASSRASGGRGERRGGASAAWGSGAVPSTGVGWGSGGGSGGGSGSYGRKRRRPGSPNSPPGEGSRKSSPSSADSSSAVREMVWSYGFPLARVLHAHDLVGDSVEDMLVLLTSDAFQPPGNSGNNEGGATAASCSSSGRDV